MRPLLFLLLCVAMLPLAGCLEGIADLGSAQDATLGRPQGGGVIRSPQVEGLRYESRDVSGETGPDGRFAFEVGEPLAFSVGGVNLGELTSGRGLVTPLNLVSGGTVARPEVVNITRFLMMLDADGDPRDGVRISPEVREVAEGWTDVDFGADDLEGQLAGIMSDVASVDGRAVSLPTPEEAQALLDEGMLCLYSGGFQGALSAGSAGRFTFAVDPRGRSLRGFVVANPTVDPQLRTLTGTSALDLTQAQISLLASDQAAVQYTMQFNSIDRIGGTWTAPDTVGQPGTIAGGRLGPASLNARFRFAGTYEGTDNGVFVLDIPREGNIVTGSLYSVTSDFFLTLNGTVDNETDLAITGEDGSTNFNGTINWETREVRGDWFNEFAEPEASGSYAGTGCRII